MPYLLRNAIFDLDGTLVDSARDIRGAMLRAYAAIGMNDIVGKLDKLVIGPPLADTMRCLTPGLAEDTYAALVANFRQAYDNSPLHETTVCPGVWDVIAALRKSNATLLLATNKPCRPTRRVLE